MLRAALGFFIFGIVALLLGAYNIGGISIDIGRTLLFVFLGLAFITTIAGLLVGKTATHHHHPKTIP